MSTSVRIFVWGTHLLNPCRCKFTRACYISAAALVCVVIYARTVFHQSNNDFTGEPLPPPQQSVQIPETGTSAAAAKMESWATSRSNKVGQPINYVVATSTCKIPEMNPRDPSILNFLQPDSRYPVDCKGSNKNWTYMNSTELIVNETAIHESGYSMESIYCCYRVIKRITQPWSDYNINADNYVTYSDTCHPIHNGHIIIDAEFIRVHCISKLPPLYNDVIYRDFYAIAQPSSDRLVTRKLLHWKRKLDNSPPSQKSSSPPPPNVVIIGVDNNSRMNAHRHLSKTLNILQSLGAVELLGYTKVAENTFPNTVPFIAGYNDKQLESICYNSSSDPHDNCPYIWKAFDNANYLTVHAEDAPYLGGFNYLKTGFVKKPTDFYLRPIMLAVMSHMPRPDYYHTDCIGSYMTDEFTLNYMLDVIRLGASHGAPVFIHNWLTSLAHHSFNNLQFGDNTLANFIQGLVSLSNDNTIFFFMSDHGQRYGPIRETTQGWYEDKLPTQWVYIPKHLRSLHPEWHKNLEINAGRLTSHYDVYKTILQILKIYDREHVADKFYKASASQFGTSLLTQIPENRTCDDAGISVNYCACSKPKPVDVHQQEVLEAAQAALKYLRQSVPLDVCAEPTLKSIESAGFMDLPKKPVYVVNMRTDPGNFLFEVNVEQERDTGQFVITTDLLRMNKITRAANCVNTPLLERYCYCK